MIDLWHRDRRELANLVLNRYLDAYDEADGVALLPFFMAIRAAIRAHVMAMQAAGACGRSCVPALAEARAYFELARSLLGSFDPGLLAIGGLSGSGKSTLAAAVASHLGPPPGARILNSDRVRKRLHGVPAEARLPKSAYGPEISEAVHAALRREAARTLATGCSLVVDAVFNRPSDRAAIGTVALGSGIPFRGVWLEAPPPSLLARIDARRNDPSDATAEVLAAQLRLDQGEIAWQHLDGERDPTELKKLILASFGRQTDTRAGAVGPGARLGEDPAERDEVALGWAAGPGEPSTDAGRARHRQQAATSGSTCDLDALGTCPSWQPSARKPSV